MKSAIALKILILALCFSTGLQSCKRQPLEVSKIVGTQIPISDSLPQSESITDFIAPYKRAVDREMDSVLAYAPRTLDKKNGAYNTAIGNMMADAVLELANPIFKQRSGKDIDIVLLNYGGIRSIIAKGDITTRTAYEVMPFENSLVVVELPVTAIQEMVKYLAHGTAHPFTGLELVLNTDEKLASATVNGEPLDAKRSYYVCTSDYLQNGGDNMDFLGNPESIVELDYKIRNLLIDYFRKRDTIAPMRDGRFIKRE